jgi:hypothetical protein
VKQKENRQQEFRTRFDLALDAVRREHGAGANSFSWAEGMTRRAARKIARNRARRAMRAQRALEAAKKAANVQK